MPLFAGSITKIMKKPALTRSGGLLGALSVYEPGLRRMIFGYSVNVTGTLH